MAGRDRDKTVISIRHVAFENLGLLGPFLEANGYTNRYVDAMTVDWSRIDPLEPALIVVLGGPIGADQDSDYPFLLDEVALIDSRLKAGKPLLGICLGAQLIARALGKPVYPGPRREVGWAPIEVTDEGRLSCLRHLENGPVLHWHGDTFDLPDGAVRLASTELCENQAFSWGSSTLALQFHVEVTETELESWFIGHTVEIASTPNVSVSQLRADTQRHGVGSEERGLCCLADWFSEVGL